MNEVIRDIYIYIYTKVTWLVFTKKNQFLNVEICTIVCIDAFGR